MNIGEVTQLLGMPASTIRYYEKEGLIAYQSRTSGRRNFNSDAVVTLQFIFLAQTAGFSLTETKFLLENYRRDARPASLWRPLVDQKQASIRQKIKDLQRMDHILDELKQCQCSSLKQCVDAAEDSPCFKEPPDGIDGNN